MATYKQVGEHLGLTGRRISSLVQSGVLPTAPSKGGMDIDKCRVAYIRYLRAVKSGKMKDGTSKAGRYEKERARLVAAQADAQETKNKQISGELVEVEEVENEWVRIAAITRANLLTIPTKAAMDLHHADSVQEAQAILKKVIYEVLTDLSNES